MARLSWPVCLVTYKDGLPVLKMVTHPSTNRARRWLTSLMRPQWWWFGSSTKYIHGGTQNKVEHFVFILYTVYVTHVQKVNVKLQLCWYKWWKKCSAWLHVAIVVEDSRSQSHNCTAVQMDATHLATWILHVLIHVLIWLFMSLSFCSKPLWKGTVQKTRDEDKLYKSNILSFIISAVTPLRQVVNFVAQTLSHNFYAEQISPWRYECMFHFLCTTSTLYIDRMVE